MVFYEFIGIFTDFRKFYSGSQQCHIDFTIQTLQQYIMEISNEIQDQINIDVITNCFKNIKSIRNDLAHGHKSFTISSQTYTISTIEQYIDMVYHVLYFFITSTKKSLEAQSFLNSSRMSPCNSSL
jgi:hypothetical protein